MLSFEALDMYPKLVDDFRVSTTPGGSITLVGTITMLLLFWSEFSDYLAVRVEDRLRVDTTLDEKLRVSMNITFPNVPCARLHLDIQESSGQSRLDFHKTMAYRGAKLSDKNTLDIALSELQEHATPEAHAQWAGCNVAGTIEVAKIIGIFNFASGMTLPPMFRNDMARIILDPAGINAKQNMSHFIHLLQFGPAYKGQVNPLDGKTAISSTSAGTYKYYLKIVHTEYTFNKEGLFKAAPEPIKSAQYSSTTQYSDSQSQHMLPSVAINYDVSPIMHTIIEKQSSFLHFIVRTCAVVGGVFSVMGLIDSLMYHSGFSKVQQSIA